MKSPSEYTCVMKLNPKVYDPKPVAWTRGVTLSRRQLAEVDRIVKRHQRHERELCRNGALAAAPRALAGAVKFGSLYNPGNPFLFMDLVIAFGRCFGRDSTVGGGLSGACKVSGFPDRESRCLAFLFLYEFLNTEDEK